MIAIKCLSSNCEEVNFIIRAAGSIGPVYNYLEAGWIEVKCRQYLCYSCVMLKASNER